ncbi:sensor histidine kinase [Gorillibacterium timonense]|uniref:sensor histidine kinase n=1 Tax=Gorillibacterium timonense TaxID=1689269 RepID=UPI00071D14BA|nr:HAMP domain-containing sensor histidine kinase [Gorillibacterium timonense]
MKPKWLKKRDLFVQTQRKLTFTYAWLIIVFLMLFSMIVSIFFLGMAYREQRQLLHSSLYATENGDVIIPDLSNSRGDDLYFFYILDDEGKVIADSTAIRQNRDDNLDMIERWHPRRDGFRLKWLPESDDHHDGDRYRDKDRLLFVGARPYVMEDGRKAVIYAARDVTFYAEAFQNLLLVLLFILVLFVIAAVWLSYSMSKKAMIPIQQTYRQQQQFLADASHELRTPLSILNTSLDVIELENGEDLTRYSREVVSDMKEEVGRMSRMVQHLLTLARSDSGSVEFEMASFDLVPRVRQWVQAVEAVAQKKQITLTTSLPEKLAVTADVERIKQLVYILLDNAIKYTPEKGTVDVTLGSHPKQWYLSIRDTGIGIPEESKQRIFDRFYRAEEHRSREEGSAGLGLSIAKWIVEVHRGSIEVESTLGDGSTFIVKFPQA